MTYARRHLWLWLAILVAWAVVCPALATAADATPDPATVIVLKKQYQELANEYRALMAKQKDLLARQGQLANEIEKLQESDPGIIGRLRLERLLASNLELSNQLSQTASLLAANEKARNQKRDAIFRAYTTEMEVVVRQMRQTRDRQAAAALAHRFYELQERRRPWESPLTVETDFGARVVEVKETDGPDELVAKADMLSDLAVKVRGAARDVGKEIARLKREMKLAAEMNSMLKEMNLFEEGTRLERRDDSTTHQTEPPPTEEPKTVAPPLVEEQDLRPGVGRAAKSLLQEIRKLENEQKVLNELAQALSAKADELRRRAARLRQKDATPSP
jgi:prefoldin subunit 5